MGKRNGMMTFCKTAALMILLVLAGLPGAQAQERDLVNDNPYYKSSKDHKENGGGYFGRESKYFKNDSAYFPGKSSYFKKESAYVKNNAPGFFERVVNSVQSLFS